MKRNKTDIKRPGLHRDVCKRGHARTPDNLTCSNNCYKCQRFTNQIREHNLAEPRYYFILAEQDNRCAVCLRDFLESTPCIDHDHSCCPGETSCGKCIRGLVCSRCNILLGFIERQPEVVPLALAYIGGPHVVA